MTHVGGAGLTLPAMSSTPARGRRRSSSSPTPRSRRRSGGAAPPARPPDPRASGRRPHRGGGPARRQRGRRRPRRLRRRPDARGPLDGAVPRRRAPGAAPGWAAVANVTDEPTRDHLRRWYAALASTFPETAAIALVEVWKRRRFGNHVFLGTTRRWTCPPSPGRWRAAPSPAPCAREELDRLLGGGRPYVDGDSSLSPEPLPGTAGGCADEGARAGWGACPSRPCPHPARPTRWRHPRSAGDPRTWQHRALRDGPAGGHPAGGRRGGLAQRRARPRLRRRVRRARGIRLV